MDPFGRSSLAQLFATSLAVAFTACASSARNPEEPGTPDRCSGRWHEQHGRPRRIDRSARPTGDPERSRASSRRSSARTSRPLVGSLENVCISARTSRRSASRWVSPTHHGRRTGTRCARVPARGEAFERCDARSPRRPRRGAPRQHQRRHDLGGVAPRVAPTAVPTGSGHVGRRTGLHG